MLTQAHQNSTDATIGHSLRSRVETRVAELTAALAAATTDTERFDINLALSEVAGMMTGDLDNIPHVVAVDMNRWLEANKHLAELHTTRATRVSRGSAASGKPVTRRTKSGKA